MHVPKIFEITDNQIIEQFIQESGFATLVSIVFNLKIVYFLEFVINRRSELLHLLKYNRIELFKYLS